MNLRISDMIEYYTIWAHQIKTPISSMRLQLQNEDSPMSQRLSADLFRIEQYVEMAMMFLRLDSESTDYVIKDYRLDDIIQNAVRKFADEFIARRLTLDYKELRVRGYHHRNERA
jgi:signal transduction histidine kinase